MGDLGLLAITVLGAAGLGVLAVAGLVAGGLMVARSLAERLPVRPDGTPLPARHDSARPARSTSR